MGFNTEEEIVDALAAAEREASSSPSAASGGTGVTPCARRVARTGGALPACLLRAPRPKPE